MNNKIYQQVDVVKSLLAENPEAVIALATYTEEEFTELRKGESYQSFKKEERKFVEALCRAGVKANNIAFVEVDSVGYYRFIAERGMELGESSRSAYAAWKLNNKDQKK